MERAEDAVTDYVPELVVGDPPVQPERGDDVQVVDAGLGRHIDDLLHHELADVGRRHGRQRQGKVVERDGELHPAAKQRLEWIVLERLRERAPDRAFGVGDRLQWVGRINDARAERHLLQPDALAEVEEHRRRVPVDLYNCSGARHYVLNPRRSNATFTAPRRPALIAYSIASR